MATLNENIQRIENAKASIKTAIEAKGVIVPVDTKIEGYSSLIDTIPTGGEIPPAPVLETLSVSNNGTFTPSQGVAGYNKVEVNVAQKVIGPAQKIEIVSNGRTEIVPQPGEDGIQGASVIVNVPESGGERIDVGREHIKFGRSKYGVFPAQYFDFSNVSDFSFMFDHSSDLAVAPLIDISKAGKMSSMFNSCPSLTSAEFKTSDPLSPTLDVTKMFQGVTQPGVLKIHTDSIITRDYYQPIIAVLPSNWTVEEIYDEAQPAQKNIAFTAPDADSYIVGKDNVGFQRDPYGNWIFIASDTGLRTGSLAVESLNGWDIKWIVEKNAGSGVSTWTFKVDGVTYENGQFPAGTKRVEVSVTWSKDASTIASQGELKITGAQIVEQ